MKLKGDFEGHFLASIIQLLCDEKKTGMLRVTSGPKVSKVYLNNGKIIYAMGSLKKGRLGQILKRDGIITEEQIQECLVVGREKKQFLGKVLVDKGYISLETLKKYNKEQVEDILYNLLFWKEGKFEYRDVEFNLEGMIVTQLNPMKLILEAARRIDEMSVLKDRIASDRSIFRLTDKGRSEQKMKIDADEERVLSYVDGKRPVRQIIEDSGYDEFIVYKVLYSMVSSGMLEEEQVEAF